MIRQPFIDGSCEADRSERQYSPFIHEGVRVHDSASQAALSMVSPHLQTMPIADLHVPDSPKPSPVSTGFDSQRFLIQSPPSIRVNVITERFATEA